MSVDSVHTEKRGSVLQVTLDRPKANAIDVATSRALGDVFAGFRDDPIGKIKAGPGYLYPECRL